MLVSLRCQSSLRISLVSPEPVLPATYGPLAPSCGGAASSATFWTPIGIRRGASSTFPKILPGEIAVDCRCEGVGCGPRTLTPDSFQQTVGKALGRAKKKATFSTRPWGTSDTFDGPQTTWEARSTWAQALELY